MTITNTHPNEEVDVVHITGAVNYQPPKHNTVVIIDVDQLEAPAGRGHVTTDAGGIPGSCSEEDITGLASLVQPGYQCGEHKDVLPVVMSIQ